MEKIYFIYKVLALSLVLLFSFEGSAIGAVSSYSFAQSSGTYTSLASESILWSTTFDDEISTAITIPSFTLDGSTYTTMYVSANGWITLGNTAPGGTDYTPISSITSYSEVISAFGNNLGPAATGTGITPKVSYNTNVSGEIVIQWQDVRYRNQSNHRLSFQIRLNPITGVISVVYGGTIGSSTNSRLFQVGLRGASNSDFSNRVVIRNTNTWAASTQGPLNSSTCEFRTGSLPVSGQTYTWTPPPAPTISNLGATSGCEGTSITINGTNLTGATSADIHIGGTPVTSITSNDGTQIVAVIGNGTTGYVTVTTGGGTATSPSSFTVNKAPTPTFTVAPGNVTLLNTSVTYTTQSGQSNYTWVLPPTGYTISSGGIGSSDNTVTLIWTTTGTKTVTVNYSNGTCFGATPATNTTNVPASGTIRYSVATGNWNSTTIWSLTSGGASNAAVPVNGNTVVIEGGYTVTVNTNTAALTSLNIASGSILSVSGTNTVSATTINVNGTYRNASTGAITGALAFGTTGIYQHNFTTSAGTIPTATWNTGSTCEIVGYTTNATVMDGFSGQSFYNFTWNCPNQNNLIQLSLGTYTTTINGDFKVVSTGSGVLHFRKTGSGYDANPTININGDWIIQGGNVDLCNAGGGTAVVGTFNLAGNFNMTGGTLSTTTTTAGYSDVLNFTGSNKTFIRSGGTFNGTVSRINININDGASLTLNSNIPTLSGYGVTVNSGGILDCSTLLVTGTGSFTLNSGATIITAHSMGLSTTAATGSIQVTGTKTYSTGANYSYDGTSAQETGNGLTEANTLTIKNAAGVTLSRAITAATVIIGDAISASIFADGGFQLTSTGVLNLNSGTFKLGALTATVYPSFTVNTLKSGSTVEYAATSAQNVSNTPTYANLVFSGTSTKTAQGGLIVNENLTISSGTFAAGNYTHTVGGNWTKSGTFTSTGTIDFNGSTAGSIGASNFNNIIFSGSGIKTATGILNIAGNISITNNFSAGNFVHTIGGNWSNTGIFSHGSGTITFTSAPKGKTISGTLSGASAFNKLIFDDVSGGWTLNDNTEIISTSTALDIKNGVLTVSAGKYLYVKNGSTTLGSAECLVLNSDGPNGTASFIDNGTISTGTTGSAKVNRFISKYLVKEDLMFHFLSSPVTSQAISPHFSDPPTNTTDDFYKFHEPTYTWINFRDDAGTGINSSFGESNLVVGRGYLVAYDVDVTKNFTGILNTGSVPAPTLSYTPTLAAAKRGWNLVGNPYPSAIDWDNVVSEKRVNLQNAVYVYDNASLIYLSYVPGSGGALTGGIIPAMQGFFVQANAASPSLTFENSDRVAGSNYYKSTPVENEIRLKVEGNERYDETFIHFTDEATTEFDGQWDAYKLYGATSVPTFYSLAGDDKLSVNSLPLSSMEGSVPLAVEAGADATYTLSLVENTLPIATYITLEDLKTGVLQRLNNEPTYSFTAAPGENPNRFLLHFKDATSIPDDPTNKEAFNVYLNSGNINIITGQNVIAEILVSNMLGQVVIHNKTNGNSLTTLYVGNLQNGVYVVSLVGNNKVVSKKIVIEK